MDLFTTGLNHINDFLWTYFILVLLIGVGLYFTVKSRFVQIGQFKEMLRLISRGFSKDKTKKDSISPFQAFCISAAARIGIGNLAGVAIAIASGGPGAIFWMWMIGLIGAATSFVECTLGQIYKVKDGGRFRGGPAYYMEKGLNKRWLGIWFSILITITYGLIFNSVQANTVSIAFADSFGWSRTTVGIAIAVLVGAIIFGGVRSIANISTLIVPPMALAYIAVAVFVVLTNITAIPEVLLVIIKGAFGYEQVVGGGIGAAMKFGIQRGLFATEAGMGSSPNAAATAHVTHPVKQGLIQALGVFVDTFLVCTSTAFIVLCSSIYKTGESTGITLTQQSLTYHIGDWAGIFLSVLIFLFAFSTLLGNYYYGETNISFIKNSAIAILCYRIAAIGMIIFGAVVSLETVWRLADLFMALMVMTNFIAIIALSKYAFLALQDYVQQRKAGKDPVFRAKSIPGLEQQVDYWKDDDH
ncbi:sodium:alanine symporter [Lysinibacillus alkalisoli]|uniref:Sodium:alanine symporter n=1 Tax=Lysinibacillus alkalisoli TaxID=1911548 RepID=A0A917G0A5_9BACI|nr:alanine/glycine:cation symporter family protein [Lysinibacillus alkalisoli]GGG16060.1 sodium:alanine symporter [Lysinibacillus alkalisoli]